MSGSNMRNFLSKFLRSVLVSLLLVLFPGIIWSTSDGVLTFGVSYAFAESGSGSSGSGSSNSGSGNSGSGSSNSGSGSSNSGHDEDDDDDRDGDDKDDKDRRRSAERLGPSANMHLRYKNGWDEKILNGRYSLVDPQGHKVADRPARTKDLNRMRAAVGH
ncbi:hypothetical protein [Sulfitobacter sp. MF3-043]|uniref:hypothetical protein n=1 Tax=Sulfitobacter sediminivivens TaxID=3252902 RepID=UPI0036D8D00D